MASSTRVWMGTKSDTFDKQCKKEFRLVTLEYVCVSISNLSESYIIEKNLINNPT